MKTVRLPCYGIVVKLGSRDRTSFRVRYKGGNLTSNLKEHGDGPDVELFNNAIEMLHSLVLAHACAGIDVKSPAYVEGVETAVESLLNAD